MNNSNSQFEGTNPKDFWDSLHMDILTSGHKLQKEDYLCYIERSFAHSLLFRRCPPIEQVVLQRLLNVKNYGYIIILDFSSALTNNMSDSVIDEFEIHRFLKSLYSEMNIVPGPMVINRMCLLISYDTMYLDSNHKKESLSFGQQLREKLYNQFQVSLFIGIGSEQNINSIYTSFIDALSALHFRTSDYITYYKDNQSIRQNTNFDIILTDKYLFEAVRLRKAEAYDYFEMIMNWIRPLSDDTKRNKIIEVLVLCNHAMSLDNQDVTTVYDYTSYVKEFMNLSGDELIEFAYRSFNTIVRYVKQQSNIDYTNHIVLATQVYLEQHFAEDISLEDVAEQVNISPQYFSKLIKKTTGFNFIDWLSMLRVKKAKELLTNSNYTVKEVCYIVGYKDPNYFSRIFKKRIGITPSEYVKTRSYDNNLL